MTHSIMTQTIVHTRCKIESAVAIINHLTKGCKALDNCPVAKLKGRIIYSKEGERSVNILNRITLVVATNHVKT